MKRRSVIIFRSWAHASLLLCSMGAAVAGLLYGAAALTEGIMGAVASERED